MNTSRPHPAPAAIAEQDPEGDASVLAQTLVEDLGPEGVVLLFASAIAHEQTVFSQMTREERAAAIARTDEIHLGLGEPVSSVISGQVEEMYGDTIRRMTYVPGRDDPGKKEGLIDLATARSIYREKLLEAQSQSKPRDRGGYETREASAVAQRNATWLPPASPVKVIAPDRTVWIEPAEPTRQRCKRDR